jgi:hypothetical protein
MPTIAETQLAAVAAWLAASSRNRKSPFGDLIISTAYGQLVACGLDDVPPDLSSPLALGCLPLMVPYSVPAAAFAATQGQARLSERAQHIEWVAGAALTDPLRGFPAVAVVRVAQGQTLRQAAVSAGFDPDADRLLVGIPAAAFAE